MPLTGTVQNAERAGLPMQPDRSREPGSAIERQQGSQHVLALQRAAGNRAVSRLVRPGGEGARPASHSASGVGGSGEPLAGDVRTSMEAAFGADFSRVRVHTGPPAARSARALGAKAYTVGHDVVFGEGRFAPNTAVGKQLLAHELAHVVQQSRGGTTAPSRNGTGPLEQEAAAAAASPSGPVTVTGASAVGVAAQPDDDLRALEEEDLAFEDDERRERRSRRERERARTTQRKVERDYARQGIKVTGEARAQAEIADMQRSAEEGEFAALSPKNKLKQLRRFKDRLKDTNLLQVTRNQLQGAFDEALRTPRSGLVGQPQHKIVAGSPELPFHDLEPGRASYAQPDYSIQVVDEHGRVVRAHVNLKSNNLEDVSVGEARGIASKAADQARKNVSGNPKRRGSLGHLPEGDRVIISYAETPSKEVQQEMLKEFFRAGSPVQEVRFGTTTHRRPPPAPGSATPTPAAPRPTRRTPAGPPQSAGTRLGATTGKVGGRSSRVTGPHRGKRSSTAAAPTPLVPEAQPAPASAGIQARTTSQRIGSLTAPTATGGPARPEATQPAASSPVSTTPTKGQPAPAAARSQPPARSAATVPEPTLPSTPLAEARAAARALGPAAAPTPTTSTAPPVSVASHGESTAPFTAPKAPEVQPAAATPVKVTAPTATRPGARPAAAASRPAVQTTALAGTTRTAATSLAPMSATHAPAPATPEAKSPLAQRARPPTTPREAPVVPATRPRVAVTPALERSGGLVVGPSQLGVHGLLGAGVTQSLGKGITTGQTVSFGGQVTTDVQEVPDTSPKQYRVTLLINLSGQAGLSGGMQGQSTSAGISAGASGSLGASSSRILSAEETARYLAAVQASSGGRFDELEVVRLLKEGSVSSARNLLAQISARSRSRQLAEGEEVSFEAGGTVQAGVSASGTIAGGVGAGIQAGISQGQRIQVSRARHGGREIFTVTVVDERGATLGGSLAEGVESFGLTHQGQTSQGRSVTFSLDPNSPDYELRRMEIEAVRNLEDLRQLASTRRDETSTTTSRGRSSELTTDAAVAGIGLRFTEGGSYSEEETTEAQGVTRRYQGSGRGGAALTVGGRAVASSMAEDTFTGTVRPGNVATGETKVTRAETDYSKTLRKAAEHPLGTVAAIATGGQVLQEHTDVQGKELTDTGYAHLAELAKDPSAWNHAFASLVNRDLGDWLQTRQKVLAANGDRDQIAKAFAEFESGGSGRSRTVENALGEVGIRFEFPGEIADQKAIYDELVVGNPISHARELAAHGNASGAVAELSNANARLGQLSQAVQQHQDAFTNAAALAEMLRRVSARRTELRAETRRLSPMPKGGVERLSVLGIERVPALAASTAQADEQARREERNTKLHDLLQVCQANRASEQARFDIVKKEYAKENRWYTKPDIITIAYKLTDLLPVYQEWDKVVAELRGIYQERGESPDRANAFAPDRKQWQELHDRGFKGW